ncbi:hypothetical protein PSOLA_01030 [Candidatus Phytoplasma solani]
MLISKVYKNVDNFVDKNVNKDDKFIYKYFMKNTTIKDEIDLWASGKQDLIAMNLSDLKKHLQQYPEDSYFFFNPKAQLLDVSQLDFGLCSCYVQKSNYPEFKDKDLETLEEAIIEDVHKHIVEKDILKCYLNDLQNLEHVFVLINLPKDIMNLSEAIRNKIEIMLRKPDKPKSIEVVGKIGELELINPKHFQDSQENMIKGFKINFPNDNQIEIFGILTNNNLTLKPLEIFDIHNENHLTFNLVKNSFTPNKALFSGTKEQTETNIVFEDEIPIDLNKTEQMISDASLFITYSFKTVKDTIQCFFDKIGIILNNEFFICQHASIPCVIYSTVDAKLTEKIKEEEKEKQRLYLIEQQRIRESEEKQQQTNMQISLPSQQTIETGFQIATVAFISYGVWQVFKWGVAIASAPATGGVSIGAAIATP